MTAALSRRFKAFCAILCMMTPLAAAPGPARAGDAFDYVVSVVRDIESVDPTALPFKADDLVTWKGIIQTCDSAGSADDVVLCVDQIVSQPSVQQKAEIPTWVPQMLAVYLDIAHKDYWGLLADAGEAVACAAAQFLLDGLDLCGAVKALVDAAEALVADAKAVVNFLKDLGNDVVAVVNDIGCLLSSCDDSAPPPPSPDEVAFQQFFLVHVDDGLAKRLASKAAWDAYAGLDSGSILTDGQKAGFALKALQHAMPRYRAAVYVRWDAKILTVSVPSVKQRALLWDDPARAQSYAISGMKAWKKFSVFDMAPGGEPPSYVFNPGHQACVNDLLAAGGAQIDAWANEGGLQHAGVPPGFAWAGSAKLCAGFDKQLKADILPRMTLAAVAQLPDICTSQGGSPQVWACTPSSVPGCQMIVALGQLTATCRPTTPGYEAIICTVAGKDVNKTKATNAPMPPHCRRPPAIQ